MGADDSETKRLSPDDRASAKQRLDDALGSDATLKDQRDSNLALAVSTPDPEGGVAGKDLADGERVGEYVIESVLGRGGFGTVYRAVQPLIGKRVAIKVLSRKYSVDNDIVSRFMAEARAVNQIRHRHIIDIFSFGQLGDGRHYYVMEYLDGEPLDRYLAARGALTLDEAIPILRAIARALDAAHAKGIAHRDLKPENIYIARDTDGEVFPKLLDFGVAKLLGPDAALTHKTGTGVPIGTPLYMSPEAARGQDIDHRTDIYSFGVLSYRLLTGAYPFDGAVIDVLHHHVHDEPVPPTARNGNLTKEVDAAIAWMMRKNPEDRPRTVIAGVMALQGEEASTASLRPAGGSARELPRTKRAAPLIALVITVAAAAAIVGVWLAGRDDAKPVRAEAPVPPPIVAPDAAVAIAPDAAPAVPAHVIVTIAGVPEGTEVSGTGVSGVAPGPVQLPRGTAPLVLTFKADGHVPVSKTVVPDREQTLDVTLKKKPRRTQEAPDPERIDDPFRKQP